MRRAQLKYRHKARCKVIDMLGAECVNCGFDDIRALQIDHINGGGSKEPMGITAYVRMLRNVEESKIRLQLLCANCNWIKRFEKGEHKGYLQKN